MELENKWETVDGYNEEDTALLEDIIFEEILPRLPMSSLLRFKCVCKKWLHSMATDKRLALNHVRHQSTTTKLSVIVSYGNYWLPWDYKLYFMDHRGGNNSVPFTDSTLYMERHVGDFTKYHIVGCCNGLICLCLRHSLVNPEPLVVLQSKGDAVVLWNPITQEVRDTGVVPPLPPRFSVGRSIADYPAHGFGYDESRDDYKVVRIFPTSRSVLNISVFSRNSGCWRQLDKCLVGYTVCDESSESVLLDGRLYWLLLALEFADGGMFVTSRRLCVLSFGVLDEEFKIISVLHNHPPYVVAPPPRPLRQLVKWDNCLALAWFPDNRPGQRNSFGFELLLDRNGSVVVGQHASGVVGFRWSSHAPSFSENGCQWKFCGVSRDQFFVEENLNLVMYDPFSHDYENVGRQEAFRAVGNLFSAHDYVPSLVSAYPDRKTMTEEKRKMEVRHWVDMFWKSLGLTRPQFGIRISD